MYEFVNDAKDSGHIHEVNANLQNRYQSIDNPPLLVRITQYQISHVNNKHQIF